MARSIYVGVFAALFVSCILAAAAAFAARDNVLTLAAVTCAAVAALALVDELD